MYVSCAFSMQSLPCSKFLALEDSKSSLDPEDPDAYDSAGSDDGGSANDDGSAAGGSDVEIVGKDVPSAGGEVPTGVPVPLSADPQPDSASARPRPEQGGSPSQVERLPVLNQEADAEGGELGVIGLPTT